MEDWLPQGWNAACTFVCMCVCTVYVVLRNSNDKKRHLHPDWPPLRDLACVHACFRHLHCLED